MKVGELIKELNKFKHDLNVGRYEIGQDTADLVSIDGEIVIYDDKENEVGRI